MDLWSVRKIAQDCEVIHCLTEPFMPLAYMLNNKNKILFHSVHGTYATSVLNTRWQNLYRKAYDSASLILPVSQYTATQLAEKFPKITDKLYVVNNGVDTSKIEEFALPAHARNNAFIMVGQIKPRKGTLQAVEAMGKVLQKFPEAKLYIVGSQSNDAYVQQVKKTILIHGLDKNVVWLGQLSTKELNHYYSQVRGLVVPSMNVGASFEGFGLVHLEANSFGVPAIGSLGCGNEDVIKDGYNGFLVEQGNIQAISVAMMQLLEPDFNWDLMSQNALKFARSMSWERAVGTYVSLYREHYGSLLCN
jgi:glycosyltransferase involved in cell wall biosynthesis